MRLFLGIIIGAAITLGAAYFHDTNLAAAPAIATESGQPAAPGAPRTIVNWDVLGTIAREQTAAVKGWWDRAIGSL